MTLVKKNICTEGLYEGPLDPQYPVTSEASPRGETTDSHPAFGQVTVSRVQGSGTNLYGSDFRHRNFVELSIHESVLNRSLSKDRPFAKKVLIRVAFSEAQWAQFVTSIGSGEGSQCTLVHHPTAGRMPGILWKEDRREQFRTELKGRFTEAEKALATARKAISDSRMSDKAKREALQALVSVERNTFGGNLDFVAESFDKHIDRNVAKAKSEIDAYALLAGRNSPVLDFPETQLLLAESLDE